jgi:hypothetical protein
MMIAVSLALALSTAMSGDEVVQTAPAGSGVVPPAPNAEMVLTAPEAAPHGLTTQQQIDRWLGARETARSEAMETLPERRMRGEVMIGVGTGGYRDIGVRMQGAIGESGWGGISVRQTDWR